MDLEKLNPDSVEEVFARHGASAITFTDAGDRPVLEPAPGEVPLWQDTRISGLFAPEADFAALQDDLLHTLDIDTLPAHEIQDLGNRAWEREWLKDFAPMRFGSRLWICPGDSDPQDDEDAVIVRLDPGLAFGTGTHATTSLCLEWLDGLELRDTSILDYGCGSGVLAIAALKLGAKSATGCDIDPQAISATLANARRNGVDDRLAASLAADLPDRQFDVVVANILAGPLIDLAATIGGYLGSRCLLALSGILGEQVEDVQAAYRHRIAFDEPVYREQGGQTWALLTGRRNEN